jgi:hypothetical protein
LRDVVYYVRVSVGNTWNILMRNVPFVRLFRNDDGVLRSRFSAPGVPMSSKGTMGVESDGVYAWLAMDGLNAPLYDIRRGTSVGLAIRNACKHMILTT